MVGQIDYVKVKKNAKLLPSIIVTTVTKQSCTSKVLLFQMIKAQLYEFALDKIGISTK
jgi:hypothetical protein